MKNSIKTVLAIVLIVAIAVCLWLIGYHTRKSQDNLPSLESIAKMDEADVNELLIGYRNNQLKDVWGDPDAKKSSENTWIWNIDEYTQLKISCNNKDKVVICSIDAVLVEMN